MKILLLIALIFLASPALAQQLYRWVDAEGNVHFSDRPPADDAELEEIELDIEISAERQAEARLRLAEQERHLEQRREINSQNAAAAAEQRTESREMNEVRNQLCAQARRNLRTLVEQGPVYRLDENGNRIFLEDNQRDAQIARHRDAVAQACQ